jgi:hypothetical protein
MPALPSSRLQWKAWLAGWWSRGRLEVLKEVLKGQVLKGQVLKGQVLKGQVLKGQID